MRVFLLNLVIKSAIVLAFCFSLSSLIYRLGWDHFNSYEVPEIVERKNSFNDLIHEKEVNTVFVGSSRIFRHVNPILFDSLTGLKSYNLGYAGLFPFRSYDFIQQLELTDNIQHIFIELAPLALLGKNFNSEPFVHSIDFERYKMAVSFAGSGAYTTAEEFKYYSGYTLLFLYKYSGVGISKYVNQEFFNLVDLRMNNDDDNMYNQGFLSLDDDLSLKGYDYNDLLQRKTDFYDRPEYWLNMYHQAFEDVESKPLTLEKDTFTAYIKGVVDDLEKRGVNVYFIISLVGNFDSTVQVVQ